MLPAERRCTPVWLLWVVAGLVSLGLSWGLTTAREDAGRSLSGVDERQTQDIIVVPEAQVIPAGNTGAGQSAGFQIVNRSASDIDILEIVATCGCTVPGVPLERRVPRGETCEIPVQITSPAFGQKDVAVFVTVASKGNRHNLAARMTLIGRTVPVDRIVSLPNHIDLAPDAWGDAFRDIEIQTIERAGSLPWIKSLECASEMFEGVIQECVTEPRPQGDLARTYRCRLSSHMGNAGRAEIGKSLLAGGQVQLVLSRRSEVEVNPIYLSVTARQDIVFLPDVVNVQAFRDGSQSQTIRCVDVSADQSGSLALPSIVSLPDGVTAEWSEATQARGRDLLVTASEEWVKSPRKTAGEIVLRDSQGVRSWQIPINIVP